MSKELTKADKDAIFEAEFLPHLQSLYNFGLHLTGNPEDAEDLLQETFLKAYRFVDYYEQGTNAKAWLLKILRNIFINKYNKRKNRPGSVSLDESYHTDASDDATVVYIRQDALGGLIGDEITNAINSLPVNYRLIILLCDLEGFQYDEIAKIIDVPLGTVRSRLHRARNMLKQKLSKYAKKLGYDDDEKQHST